MRSQTVDIAYGKSRIALELDPGLAEWSIFAPKHEEPLAEPEDGALAHLQAQTPFDLALDESLARHPAIAPSSLPVRRLVLKPAALGGLRRTLRLAGQARAAGREVVVTSLVSSAAGLWVEAQLAAATGSSLAHGLATADWLATDVGAPPPVENGMLLLPETPGSGCVATP